jgi:hypothetical protein
MGRKEVGGRWSFGITGGAAKRGAPTLANKKGCWVVNQTARGGEAKRLPLVKLPRHAIYIKRGV